MHKIKASFGNLPVTCVLGLLLWIGSSLTHSFPARAAVDTVKLPELPSVSAFDEMFKDEGWEQMANEPTIKTWKKHVAGSSLFAFRGEAIIDASIPKIAQVLADTPRKTEWVHQSTDAKNIHLISDLERIEYNRTATPFPLTDREFVFHAWTTLDRKNKTMSVIFRSIDHPGAPKTDLVRGQLIASRYLLTQLEPAKTKVLVEIHVDPKGNIPAWISNLFQRKWPYNTLDGIRKQAAKSDVPEHPKVRDFFDGKLTPLDVVSARDLR